MVFPQLFSCKFWRTQQPAWWIVVGWILVVIEVFLLAGCSFQRPSSEISLSTLVATIDLSEQVFATLMPSSTITLEPPPQLPTDTPGLGYTPTRTITAWPNDTVTAGPSPTPTRTATNTRIPTRTRAPTNTPTITRTPTITFTPTPPPPALHIVRPGLLSKVVSPIQTELYILTGDQGKFTIELVGEDGRVISRQVLSRGTDAGRRFWLAPEMPFEIEAVAETARLQISTQDEFGRLVSLSSVDLILLSVGRNELNPSLIDQEPFLIRRPRLDDVVGGGMLIVEALARPLNDSRLWIELVTENGAVMSVKQVTVDPPTGLLSHTPFTVEIPYRVSTTTPVRLVIRQEGSRIPGTVALVSQTIILEP